MHVCEAYYGARSGFSTAGARRRGARRCCRCAQLAACNDARRASHCTSGRAGPHAARDGDMCVLMRPDALLAHADTKLAWCGRLRTLPSSRPSRIAGAVGVAPRRAMHGRWWAHGRVAPYTVPVHAPPARSRGAGQSAGAAPVRAIVRGGGCRGRGSTTRAASPPLGGPVSARCSSPAVCRRVRSISCRTHAPDRGRGRRVRGAAATAGLGLHIG
mmetsp:Transcript_5689/g.20414  ORF Transcript_5689/g.20414 Transcript_5689/m.20414 type:complete len:215 (+) Transcript_5689:57-701(+)